MGLRLGSEVHGTHVLFDRCGVIYHLTCAQKNWAYYGMRLLRDVCFAIGATIAGYNLLRPHRLH